MYIMSFRIFSATELWQIETKYPSIPTFSQSLDSVLGNDGIQISSITELLGLPGSGKTQLCMQLCASVQIPEKLGGLNAEALYIDTNTNFTAQRFREILNASLLKCHKILDLPIENIEEEEGLKRLYYINAFGLEKFCAVMNTMSQTVEGHHRIKLIVIDSISFLFKEGIPPSKRTGLLFRQMAELQRLAVEKQIAVVVTNEMSTRVGLSTGSIVGSLGDAWAHRCNKRVMLSSQGDPCERVAVCLKSNVGPNTVGRFQITEEGIRDVE